MNPHYFPSPPTDQRGLSEGKWVERWVNVVRLVDTREVVNLTMCIGCVGNVADN